MVECDRIVSQPPIPVDTPQGPLLSCVAPWCWRSVTRRWTSLASLESFYATWKAKKNVCATLANDMNTRGNIALRAAVAGLFGDDGHMLNADIVPNKSADTFFEFLLDTF